METLFYLSLALNLFLLSAVFGFFIAKSVKPKLTKVTSGTNVSPPPEKIVQQAKSVVINPMLTQLAYNCKKQLPPEFRDRIKILVNTDNPEHAAILQVDDLKISIRRAAQNQSLYNAQNPIDAINIARYGYDGTGRYIPVPKELKKVLELKPYINVYFKALGLEEISDNDEFWCVDTVTGYPTGWKRFGWSAETAYECLKDSFYVRTKNGEMQKVCAGKNLKVFVLLKGWEHLFTEV